MSNWRRFASPTVPAPDGRSRSRVTRRWCWRRRRRCAAPRGNSICSWQTEIVAARAASSSTRRPRSATTGTLDVAPDVRARRGAVDSVSAEDRPRTLPGAAAAQAALAEAMTTRVALSGSQWARVLDPVVAIRCRISLDPEQSAASGPGLRHRAQPRRAPGLVGKYQDRRLATASSIGVDPRPGGAAARSTRRSGRAALCALGASSVIYAHAACDGDRQRARAEPTGRSGLWGYAISGDLPTRPAAHQPYLANVELCVSSSRPTPTGA